MSLSPTDVAHVIAIAEAAADADGVAPLDEAALLALDHRPDTVAGVVEADGFGLLFGTELAVVVEPAARGAGLGTALAAQALALAGARTLGRQQEGPVSAWMHGDSPAARALAARTGFSPARELWVMRTQSHDAITPVAAPAGVELRPFAPGDEAELLRVNAAAFAWHPEQGAMDSANLAERMNQPWFTPQDLIEAWETTAEGERMLGFHWTKKHSETLGEIYVVGVDPAAQGRGLGRALTAAGLAHMAGLAQVHLYVEADNTHAVRLYGSLGFSHAAADTHVQFQRN